MHIYIDESGNFSDPKDRPNAPSVVASLVISSRRITKVFLRFKEMKVRWGIGTEEAKGRTLSADQAREALLMLSEFDALVFFDFVDMGIEDQVAVSAFKEAQAARLTDKFTREFVHAEYVHHWVEMERSVKSLPNQLFVQFFLTTALVARTLRHATVFHTLRRPQELALLHWDIDGKDKQGLTPYEEAWKTAVLPLLEGVFVQEPLVTLKGPDYSHFKNFAEISYEEMPDKLKPARPDVKGPVSGFDGGALMADLHFPDSEKELGLQLVDIVASTARRGLTDSIEPRGWQALANLLLHRFLPRAGNAVEIGSFTLVGAEKKPAIPYAGVLQFWNHHSRRDLFPGTPRQNSHGRSAASR